MKNTVVLLLSCVAFVVVLSCSGKKGGGGCSEPQNGPTQHAGEIVGQETWLADGSPHIVNETVNVRDGATLTIEPCAEVQIAAGRVINVAYPLTPNTGTLIAEGTASKPIRFSGLAGARWGHVFVNTPGTVRLRHVTFSDGGADAFAYNATLLAYGDGTTPTRKDLLVDNVTITRSLGAGARVSGVAGFAAGSTQLVITSSGNAEFPYPLEIGEHGIDSIPDGDYTGNLRDEILIITEGANSSLGLQENATMRNRGVPYHVGSPTSSAGSGLRVGGSATSLAILTIDPGVVIRFEPGHDLTFEIEHFTGDFAAAGELRALGTAAQPIIFTSASATPAAGDWMGLWFGGALSANNRLDHVRVEYAGAECLCILARCNAETESEGAIILTNVPPSAFITNTTISNSAMHGISRSYQGTTVDFAPTNTFENVAGCDQTFNVPPDGMCPDPLPSCM